MIVLKIWRSNESLVVDVETVLPLLLLLLVGVGSYPSNQIDLVISDAISFCNVRGPVDNNSYEWLLKSKNESE